jgi:molybdopterin-containing oxidoreductase family iron-sulfur binding subunit
MTKAKKYWKGLAELTNDPAIDKLKQNEFQEEIPVDNFLGDDSLSKSSTSRRDFLKFLGFSTAAATLASCETPITKSIPYVIKPEEITPGVANWYASTFYDGNDFANVLVKTRDGRPIFIKSNNLSEACPNGRVISSVLSLYDSNRIATPIDNKAATTWNTIDKKIISALDEVTGKIVVLSNTIISPTTQNSINKFTKLYNAQHIQYDHISYNGMLEANLNSFGIRSLPSYYFNKADVIVSFGADFLANWLLGFEKQYIENRNPKLGKMSRHYQIESNMSLTGSNADVRIPVKPSEQSVLLESLYNALKGNDKINPLIKDVYDDLTKSYGKSLVVSSSNDVAVQTMVNAINDLLGNYGTTLDITTPCYIKAGDDAAVQQLVQDMNDGKIGALFVSGVNPAYTLYNSKEFIKGLKNVSLTVSTSLIADETASKMQYLCPGRHYLESWGDARHSHGKFSFMQPTIQPLFDSRQIQDSFLTWSGSSSDYLTDMKSYWKSKTSWANAIQNGVVSLTENKVKTSSFKGKITSISQKAKGLELSLYQSIALGDGSQANNPWLQELPDPITRSCWDNYLMISATTARQLSLKNWHVSNGALNGDIVNISVNGESIYNVPVLIQPGQANNSLGLAVGYGRTHVGKGGNEVGVNAYPLAKDAQYSLDDVQVTKVEGEHEFASVQLHHTMMGRDLIKETTLANFINDSKSGNPDITFPSHNGDLFSNEATLWQEHDLETGHQWNLSVDLTSCTGCGACVIACHSENNVPVVGKEEVRKGRDMHWLRIDRYYTSDMTENIAEEQNLGAIDKYKAMEIPSENPQVAFQPLMCQHCNHAPCETVCPVGATSHSSEGLNHMTYNRCIGTRYCANNCPYKVRRFNWFNYTDNDDFDYNMNDDLGKMVLNPDVTVRSRGVMEKCSMCIQMTQKVKLDAKKAGRQLRDQDVECACSSACSTGSLTFGDVNDPDSAVSKKKREDTKYYLLEELNTAPSVFYHTKIRNTKA